MGISAIEFINKTRIDEASKLIRETDMQIQNVAESVGLNDTRVIIINISNYFS